MRILNTYIEPACKRDLPLDDLILKTLRHHYDHQEVFDDEFIYDCAGEIVRLIKNSSDRNARYAIELAMMLTGQIVPRESRK